jgi:neutral ceramidase
MGSRVRAAVLDATRGAGINRAIISGLANEYLQYFTTPEEYQWQAYEGGSTLYGRFSSNMLQFADVDLAKALADGKPAPEPYAFDPTKGVQPGTEPFSPGADKGTAGAQPAAVRRLQRAQFSWTGGDRGYDRPLGRAFVTIQRKSGKRWRNVTSDLGLQILWEVDPSGVYTAKWEVPLSAQKGRYRFKVTANKYGLTSDAFKIAPSTALEARLVKKGGGQATVELAYPQPVTNVDLTYRPAAASGGAATFRINGRNRLVKVKRGRFVLKLRAGDEVALPAGAGRDRYGNKTNNALGFSL